MRRRSINPTGRLKSFGDEEIIVSKTDLRGVITYVNDVFVRVSGYRQGTLLGAPHNIIRHPAMPRCVFKLLWDTVQAHQEVFAYVLNMSRSGDGYWVFAHVTPSYDVTGVHVGYHSNRRTPYADALQKVQPLYTRLLQEESRHSDRRQAVEAGTVLLNEVLSQSRMDYAQFVFNLSAHTRLGTVSA